MHPLAFWGLFTIAAVWAQRFVGGVDFLAPGLIVCLQAKHRQTAVWLAAAWILLQEGMGSLDFGALVLWYAVLAALYITGRWLFEPTNVLFVGIIGLALGIWHFALMQMMGSMQGLTLPSGRIALESVLQAVIFTAEWGLLSLLYRVRVRHAWEF
jgi:hypothetical protein